MTHRSHLITGVVAVFATALVNSPSRLRGQRPRLRQIAAVTPAELHLGQPGGSDDSIARAGDATGPGRHAHGRRRHTRYTQTVNGVSIYGADVARQTDEKGLTVSIFGEVYEGVSIYDTLAEHRSRA